MKYICIKEIFNNYKKFINKEILINGWVKNKRKLNNLIFIDINDGSCLNCLQIIIKKNKYNNILNISSGFSITVEGYLIKSIKINQKVEFIAKNINIIGNIKDLNKYPLSSKKHNFEYLREILHLRSRTYFFGCVSRIRNYVFYKIHEFMQNYNLTWIPAPIITSVDTEGFSKMFKIISENNKNFFNKDVFLTVSGQLNAEVYACSMLGVYIFGPVFRAEDSNTRKHLAEFWMIEPEISFYNLEDIINFSEIFIKEILKSTLNNNLEDINYINKKLKINNIYLLEKYINNKFINISYDESINILNKSSKFNIKWGENFNKNHENFLLKLFNLPIFITNFPKEIKPFYMKINKNKKTVSSMDLIFPNIGEIIGGSEREYRFDILNKSMNYFGIKNDWYLDLRKNGTVPHSGFGIGFERLIMLITGINNIRDISAFPRYPGNISC